MSTYLNDSGRLGDVIAGERRSQAILRNEVTPPQPSCCMLRPTFMRTVIATAVLLVAPLVARANTELTIKSERTTIPVKGMQRINDDKGPPTNQTIHLTLGARWMQWDDGSDQGVYDFVKSVDISVDLKAHRLVEGSLYAALSGRAAELDNRLMLGRVLEAGKVENNPMAGTMAEHQLSLRHDVR